MVKRYPAFALPTEGTFYPISEKQPSPGYAFAVKVRTRDQDYIDRDTTTAGNHFADTRLTELRPVVCTYLGEGIDPR